MSNPPYWLLNETCNILTQGTSYLLQFAKAYQFNINHPLGKPENSTNVQENQCNDFSYKDFIKSMKDTTPENEDRSWTWQTCVEFGYYSGSYPPTLSVFPYLPVDTQISWCEEVFNIPNMKPDTDWTNAYYGGWNLQATNVLFTNGLLDPWHLLSINHNLTSGVEAVTYEAGHCGTMIASSDIDPPSLVFAREYVFNFLVRLLNL